MNIYLIGGGEMNNGETKHIDTHFAQNMLSDGDLLFFPTAAHDSIGYIESVKEYFQKLSNKNTQAVYISDTKEQVIEKIQNAAGIYLGGGETQVLIDFIHKHNLVAVLQDIIQKNIPIAGMSAGALALAQWYVHEEGDTLEIRKGWGILKNACVYVHAQQEMIPSIQNLLHNHSEAKQAELVMVREKEGKYTVDGKDYSQIR